MKKGEILELSISDLAFGGKGLAKVDDGFVIFVDGALPGQVVRAKLVTKKKKFGEAKLLEILKRSSLEVENDYQEVPGAPWAKLPSDKQLEFKVAQVKDLFKKFAKLDITSLLDEVISSPVTWNYRNKMEFSFGFSDEDFEEKEGKKKWRHFNFSLGSKKRGQFHLVENLESPSGLFDEEFEKIVSGIRSFCEKTKLQPYNQKTNEGFFRHLVVRKSFLENKFLINLVTTSRGAGEFDREGFVNFLREKLSDRIAGIFWSQNDAVSDTAGNFENRELLWGTEKLTEKLCDLEFEISMDSFFQTNVKSAELLNKKCVQYCDLKKSEIVLDLYCGTGTIGQILSKAYPDASVVGVEIVESAVRDARENAKRNSLENIEFHCEDVRKFLKTFDGKVSTIVLDPPRSGIVPKALERVVEFGADKIVYVSCNPATMARDTEIFQKSGYQLQKISIVDQFPHTSHVECVGLFCLS